MSNYYVSISSTYPGESVGLSQFLSVAPSGSPAEEGACCLLRHRHFKRETLTPRFFPSTTPHPYPHKYQQTACRLSILARGGQPRIGSQIKVCPVWGVCQWAEGEEGRSGDSEGRFEPGKRIKQPRKIFTAEKSILLEVVGGRVSGELLCSSVSILIRTHES